MKANTGRRAKAAVLLAAFAVLAMSARGASAEDGAGHKVEAPGPVAEPEGFKNDDYRSPVPPGLKGAKVIGADEAEVLLGQRSAVFIDVFPRAPKPPDLPKGTVWRDPTHLSIAGGVWLPNVGYGVLSPEHEAYFKKGLSSLTGGDTEKAVVFYCLRNCWMSWNAAKRALAWGHKNVIWFSEGTDAWQEAGNELVKVEPLP